MNRENYAEYAVKTDCGGERVCASHCEEERDEYVANLQERNVKFEIARMKGLGEMDAEELNETTMDIEKRVLRKITVEDARLADEVFSELMGDEVELRRKFIEENAKFVKNLDI